MKNGYREGRNKKWVQKITSTVFIFMYSVLVPEEPMRISVSGGSDFPEWGNGWKQNIWIAQVYSVSFLYDVVASTSTWPTQKFFPEKVMVSQFKS